MFDLGLSGGLDGGARAACSPRPDQVGRAGPSPGQPGTLVSQPPISNRPHPPQSPSGFQLSLPSPAIISPFPLPNFFP